MKCHRTELDGVLIIEPQVHRDSRGFLVESYHNERYHDAGISLDFVQDNHSSSLAGTLRGLHAQRLEPQGKLVRAIEGEIFDVAVDIRSGSPTFARWVGVNLSAENFKQIYIPTGYAHGFCVLSERAQVEYKCTALYAPDDQIVVAWDDPDIGIEWPIAAPTLSDRDSTAPRLRQIEASLPVYES